MRQMSADSAADAGVIPTQQNNEACERLLRSDVRDRVVTDMAWLRG